MGSGSRPSKDREPSPLKGCGFPEWGVTPQPLVVGGGRDPTRSGNRWWVVTPSEAPVSAVGVVTPR